MSRAVELSPQARWGARLPAFLAPASRLAAERARATLLAAIDSLSELADRGQPAPKAPYRQLVVPFGRSAYRIRYRVEPDRVRITRILHAREGG